MVQSSFSIVVVCLNPGEKLAATINSILAQQYGNYEIIIKDGGSKDGSIEKLPADSRIRLFSEKDSGIYDAMNQALSRINGQYVLFLNCGDLFYDEMECFVRMGRTSHIISAIQYFVYVAYKNDFNTAYLEVSQHYAQGAKKYEDRNMEKGLPWHSMVDSALRHYTKWRRGDDDEPHDRAVIWNLLTLLYMVYNKPELNDLPCKEDKKK